MAAPPVYSQQAHGYPQPVVMAPPVPLGAYYANPPAPQQIVMVQQPPEYNYKPGSYLILSIVMTVFCSIFSPLTVCLTIPAILFAVKSEASRKLGHITLARNQGLVAAYLNFAAVILAFVLALLVTGLVIGLYSPVYYRDHCRDYDYHYRNCY